MPRVLNSSSYFQNVALTIESNISCRFGVDIVHSKLQFYWKSLGAVLQTENSCFISVSINIYTRNGGSSTAAGAART